MARKKSNRSSASSRGASPGIPAETKRAIAAIFIIVLASFLALAGFGVAGPAGANAYEAITYLVGTVGYFFLPLTLFVFAGTILGERRPGVDTVKALFSALFILSGLGFVEIVFGNAGLIGTVLGSNAVRYLDVYASLILLGGLSLTSLLIIIEGKIPLSFFSGLVRSCGELISRLWQRMRGERDVETLYDETGEEIILTPESFQEETDDDAEDEDETEDTEDARAARQLREDSREEARASLKARASAEQLKSLLGTYTPPPLVLLAHDTGRPGVGDIKANANIIRRTLQNFGITVELDEISIGPSVTRYAIKPAEGVRLQRIVSLQTNLELALAAHPVRIEAPIPGKSLVGVEVPNHTKVTVGLGTLLGSPDFADSHKPLLVALGRDIAGGSHFGNIAKMPHALIAGATGSGKSVAIHTIITSLLYRCGPQQLRFLMIDPKRVELTMYNRIPHLLSPVITDAKKAIMSLRWACKEMERRYEILEQEQVRDVASYHQNILAPALEKLRNKGATGEGEVVPEGMPYIVIVIDELADIMQTFPRELEATIVRLAQMSRAVGIHLLLSTQRPSVNVITGLIKANVPSRIALQVASQVDSRTILDQMGAEKLLGAGDMLYLSADMSKPIRLQSAFISESEVKKIVDFISSHNDAELPVDLNAPSTSGGSGLGAASMGDDDEIDDDLYEAARGVVEEAGKASTSYLQRKLRIGYARAARIMDLLEERGVIGPADGAKPRDILGGSSVGEERAE